MVHQSQLTWACKSQLLNFQEVCKLIVKSSLHGKFNYTNIMILTAKIKNYKTSPLVNYVAMVHRIYA